MKTEDRTSNAKISLWNVSKNGDEIRIELKQWRRFRGGTTGETGRNSPSHSSQRPFF